MKRIISIILALIMLLSSVSVLTLCAYAESSAAHQIVEVTEASSVELKDASEENHYVIIFSPSASGMYRIFVNSESEVTMRILSFSNGEYNEEELVKSENLARPDQRFDYPELGERAYYQQGEKYYFEVFSEQDTADIAVSFEYDGSFDIHYTQTVVPVHYIRYKFNSADYLHEGDKLTVTDGSKHYEFTFILHENHSYLSDGEFMTADGISVEDIYGENPDVRIDEKEPQNSYLSLLGCKVPYKVDVLPWPVKNITAEGYVAFNENEYSELNYSEIIQRACRNMRLRVDYIDGTTKVYTYKNLGPNQYWFYDEQGNPLDDNISLDFEVREHLWKYGNKNYISVWYMGVSDFTTIIYRNGWNKFDGKWYYFKTDRAHTGWLQLGKVWYHMDANGVMQSGWQKIKGKWYYFNSAGVMKTGWLKSGGKWYYLNASGDMATGWKKVSNKWYYFNNSGIMLTGWQKISNKWYYFNSSGAMLTGWLKSSGKWYYLKSDGSMATGRLKIGSKYYSFTASGECRNP